MEKKYTLWERITNDTPIFFKKAQVFGAGLVVLSVSLAEIKLIPGHVVAVIASVGGTITALSQFAVSNMSLNNDLANEKNK